VIVKSFLTWIQAIAASLGAPGLFLVAALDSSFLSLPQVNDLLLILSVTRHPELMPLYASMSTLGSLAGCFVMYAIGRKGGEALLRRKRFSGPRTARALALFNRFGMLAVLVPAILPPPAPFKIFVILAGVSRMSPWTFGTAVVLGRGFRYFGEGFLAVWYGERALAFLEENGRQVALWTGLTVLGFGLAYFWWRSRRRPAVVAPLPPA
jgi:membrane protein YqaA with SNARE-associated domain